MTPATKQIIRVALDGDATITTDERDRIMVAVDGKGKRTAKDDPDVRTYTATEVARLLRTSLSTVNRMKRRGELETVRVGGWTKIKGASLDRFASRRETA